jgi:hypothetical protein
MVYVQDFVISVQDAFLVQSPASGERAVIAARGARCRRNWAYMRNPGWRPPLRPRRSRLAPPLAHLFIEPDVFPTIPVEDAVDHEGQPFDVGLPARPAARIEDDRPGAVLGQLAFDRPDQLLAPRLVGLDRLLLDQFVDLRTAITVIVQIPAAAVCQVEVLVGIGPASREVETDDVILPHNLR